MATVRVPDKGLQLTDAGEIRRFLHARGIRFEHRPAEAFHADASDTEILQAHDSWLKPLMEQQGYRTADVIRVTPATPNLPAIRDKFLREHTHSEDEVRLFVEGEGHFWFHLDTPDTDVFSVRCSAGDLLTVPANTKHWFDLGPEPRVCAIRVFTDQAGWVPHYTHSGIEQRYS
jgi:1,2-dihydroxy-3-keto-5-methylthiopentene dioxygenase